MEAIITISPICQKGTNMKKILIIALTVTSLVGCVSQETIALRQNAINEAQNELSKARENATITCINKRSCEKAFSLAKIYVQENADMKIQFSDDTIVSTYNPIKYGYVGLRASKIPGTGDSSTIELVASCVGMENQFTDCARRVAPIYKGFRPFIESKLK